MIIIHAFFTVDPSQREAFLEHSKQVVLHSRGEEGNISYQLLEDSGRDNEFVFLEVWKDAEAIVSHEETEHFKLFVKNLQPFLLEPVRVEKYLATEKL
ncbi:putative quinol monooxygenase [Peribacillus glennii]|uniref:Antibiotic biosynthesis monooxygenase n=1 Tax=Peribacillus glennii TaxID=2303991 RepID=A0A372LJN1_9BACI|nr:putative quinol monooxygenase [Peribacillus glennii]RFU66635.1 antibiotic biosynthesis monooxygenase [Peribacillus glennii]